MATKKNNTAIVLKNNGGLALLQQIEEMDAQRQKLMDTPFLCGDLSLRGTTIKTCNDIEQLVKINADLNVSSEAYASSQLELETGPIKAFNVDGHSLANIKHDIKLRIQFLRQAESDKLIKEMKSIASKYITPQEEQERDFARLQEMMSKIGK
jgi:hypothetical protein